ncbi:MAG: c-type cytochrome [Chromatiales bacterium]|nr:c-type cytochrome [Chromatiales bacterium]
MTKTLAKIALAATALLVAQMALAEAGGAMIGRTCNGCHGTDGVSKGAAPSLKGLPADYLAKAMKDFKADARPATIMNRIAKGYSDAELGAVAQYFATMK